MDNLYILVSYDTRDLNDPIHALIMIIGKECWDYFNYYFLETLSAVNQVDIPYRARN